MQISEKCQFSRIEFDKTYHASEKNKNIMSEPVVPSIVAVGEVFLSQYYMFFCFSISPIFQTVIPQPQAVADHHFLSHFVTFLKEDWLTFVSAVVTILGTLFGVAKFCVALSALKSKESAENPSYLQNVIGNPSRKSNTSFF